MRKFSAKIGLSRRSCVHANKRVNTINDDDDDNVYEIGFQSNVVVVVGIA